jgi:hypothetical protein
MSTERNSSTHIDKWVIYLFIGVFLISAGTWAFRYTKNSSCDEVLFSYEAKEYRAGEMIKFKNNSFDAENWKWEFGDNSAGSSQKEPLHIFEKEGEYQVRLVVNGFCERTESITIKEKVILLDSTKFPVFTIPESIRVGETLSVKDETENADTWEWRFGENATVDANTRRADYVYETSGLKTVRLMVNGDETHVTNKKINVIPLTGETKKIDPIGDRQGGWNVKQAPSDAGPVVNKKEEGELSKPKTVPYISERNFEAQLLLVASERIKVQAFSEYFCGNLNLPIVVDGKSSTFLLLCEKIKGKSIKIKSLSVIRVPGSNCITNLTIEYKRKLL